MRDPKGDYHVEIEVLDRLDWTSKQLEHKVFSDYYTACEYRDEAMVRLRHAADESDDYSLKSYLWYENPEDAE